MLLFFVQEKLKRKKHQNTGEFAFDVRQVFVNCALYNKPRDPIGQLGTQLCSAFEACVRLRVRVCRVFWGSSLTFEGTLFREWERVWGEGS